jgi:hypothetical protein
MYCIGIVALMIFDKRNYDGMGEKAQGIILFILTIAFTPE